MRKRIQWKTNQNSMLRKSLENLFLKGGINKSAKKLRAVKKKRKMCFIRCELKNYVEWKKLIKNIKKKEYSSFCHPLLLTQFTEGKFMVQNLISILEIDKKRKNHLLFEPFTTHLIFILLFFSCGLLIRKKPESKQQ